MARLRPALVLCSLAVACGEEALEPAVGLTIQLGAAPVGHTIDLAVEVPSTESLDLGVDHPDLTAWVSGPAEVTVSFRPSEAGAIEASLMLAWPDHRQERAVRARGRWPTIRYAPEAAELTSAFADIWLWPEVDAEVFVAVDSHLPPCPGAPCVEMISARAVRGLPAIARVHGPLDEASSFSVATCTAPECATTITALPSAEPPPIVFAAAPVGQPSLRTTSFPGTEAVFVSHPELSATSDGDNVAIEWTPQEAGPLDAEIERDGQVRRVIGYALEVEPCSAAIEPAEVFFSAVPVGASATQAVELRNRGPDACLWSSVTAFGPGFSAGAFSPRWIEPGTEDHVDVHFRPRAEGRHEGTVDLGLSDAPGAGHRVAVTGFGAISDLEVVTEGVDFGSFTANCVYRTRPVYVVNHGQAPGRVLEANVTGPGAEFVEVDAPMTVPPGATVGVEVRLRAEAEASVDAALALTIEDSRTRGTHDIPIHAEVAPQPWVVDEFMQLALPKHDVVFVIDPSISGIEQSTAANLQAFAQFANAVGFDLRAAVASTEPRAAAFEQHATSGASFFDSADPDFEDLLVQTAMQVVSRTSSVSPAIARAYASVTSSTAADWMREDAPLSIVTLSGRADESPDTTDQWVMRLLSIKGPRNTNLFSYSAIVGPSPEGCEIDEFSAAAAPRHIELANRTGGVLQSICTPDWSRSLESYRYVSFGFKSRFFLTSTPREATIEVWVNDEPVPQRDAGGGLLWTYDFSTNSINFSPFGTPPPGASIVVRYRPVCL